MVLITYIIKGYLLAMIGPGTLNNYQIYIVIRLIDYSPKILCVKGRNITIKIILRYEIRIFLILIYTTDILFDIQNIYNIEKLYLINIFDNNLRQMSMTTDMNSFGLLFNIEYICISESYANYAF